MAEEDVIFGKNRHFYGGIGPDNMKSISVKVGDVYPILTWELPDDTVIDGYTVCTVAGAEIRRKSGSYPTSEFDGTLVAVVDYSGKLADTGGTASGAYYYRFFPFSEQGVYNRSTANEITYNV